MYIQHRRLDQPKTGRRILESRRAQHIDHNPDRRTGMERRIIIDRRLSNLAEYDLPN